MPYSVVRRGFRQYRLRQANEYGFCCAATAQKAVRITISWSPRKQQPGLALAVGLRTDKPKESGQFAIHKFTSLRAPLCDDTPVER